MNWLLPCEKANQSATAKAGTQEFPQRSRKATWIPAGAAMSGIRTSPAPHLFPPSDATCPGCGALRSVGGVVHRRSKTFPNSEFVTIPDLQRTTALRYVLRRARETGNVGPPPHSITSSAAACSVSGTVRPSAFAAFRLMTSSNRIGS